MRARAPLVAALLLACASAPPPAPPGATSLRSDLYVQAIAPGVWRHVSYRLLPDVGPFPSNGLIAAGAKGVLVVDTAWDSEQTALILEWVAANLGAVHAVVVTHAHDDRLGGLTEVQRRRIPTYALARTVELAAQHGAPPIEHTVTSAFSLERFGISGELFFPGPGHTADNATVWLAEPRVLDGGCLVRAAAATSMGNTDDADLAGWPGAIAALQARYPDARIVVPGHGEPGGPELLAHTQELLRR